LNDPIRILIVDDHAVVRKGLAMVLRIEPGLEVVGETGDGREAVQMAAMLRPDVVLLDRVMPDMGGKEIAKAIKEKAPDVRILILTGTEVDDKTVDILEVGVDGYVLKEIEPIELKRAIRTIARGEAYLHPAVARKVLDDLPSRPRSGPSISLTARELEVLQWMAKPLPYREIAKALFISEETVRSHAKRILKKLGQTNRFDAVREARTKGLID